MAKMTFQPKKRQRSKVHGFRARMSTPGGRKVLKARRAKGRKRLSAYVNRYLVLYVCGNGLGRNRIGISVSKKVGNSVVRHRITRLIRESYRLHEQMFNSGLDMAVVARQAARDADYHRIEYALLQLAGKAGIYDKKRHD